MRARAWISVAVAASVLVGGGVLAVSASRTIAAAPVPSAAALEAVGSQLFPKDPQHPYYVECVNLPEQGIAPTAGNDYSACPLTDRMRARLVQKQTHLCPCELNPSTTREINAQPRPGGGRLTVVLYQGHAQVYEAVLAGHPVVTWVTYQWVTLRRQAYIAFDGRVIPYAGPGEHAVTVVGVDPTRVLVNNPWSAPEWVSKALFERVYLTYNEMAVVVA